MLQQRFRQRRIVPHAFGLRTPAPLWTAPAFDRCLLVALIYPIATIFIIWAVSGHVGPAEKALQLPADAAAWRRAIVALIVAFLFSVVRAVYSHVGGAVYSHVAEQTRRKLVRQRALSSASGVSSAT